MSKTKHKIRTHANYRNLGREFKNREKIQYTGHPNRGMFSVLSKLIPLVLQERGQLTATELANAIKKLYGLEFKRNTISEICTKLCSKQVIVKESKNIGQGRPKIYFNALFEVNAN